MTLPSSRSLAERPITKGVKVLAFLAGFGLAGGALLAGDPAHPDKSGYHLFAPTPPALMREMNTDRPDLTESPYTVDAGHFQVEAEVVRFSYDRRNPERSRRRVERLSFAEVNFKAGLFNNTDLQVIVPVYSSQRVSHREPGEAARVRGFGDLTARLKVNFWGNDGGQTAFAAMPFVKFPTARAGLGNEAVEGGLILPWAVEFPRGWAMGVMAEFDLNQDEQGGGYHLDVVESVTFNHGITRHLSGYAEFVSIIPGERGAQWIAAFDVGFTYAVTADLQLDAGVDLGITRAAEDASPFLGVSWRF